MNIEWGSRSQTLNLGPCPALRCETCGADRPHSRWLRYSYEYLFDPALSKVLERKYVAICETCGQGALLDTKTVEASLKKDPIPWQHRHGFVIGGAAIVAVGLLVYLASTLR